MTDTDTRKLTSGEQKRIMQLLQAYHAAEARLGEFTTWLVRDQHGLDPNEWRVDLAGGTPRLVHVDAGAEGDGAGAK